LIITTQNYLGEEIKENDTDGAYKGHNRGEICIHNVCHKIRKYVRDQEEEDTMRIEIVREEVA
jgi:hypothetical protein